MKLKYFIPKTPSLRNLIRLNTLLLEKKPLLKTKIKGIKKTCGRNSVGQLTTKCKGGGNKKKYRILETRQKLNFVGIVISIEYDPFKSSNIAAIYNYLTNYFFYIIAPKDLKIGDIIKSGMNAEIKNGHSMPLYKVPIGCLLHNISFKRNSNASVSKAAGTFSKLIEKNSKFAKIKLSSGKQTLFSINCLATIGIVSNELSFLTTIGKAGRSRWLNKRPKVRGVAMNPVDHPHGGGEGKTSGGRKTSVTPWGKPTKIRKIKIKK